MQLSISEAARLYNKHRATVHRNIKSGLLSCSYRGDGTRAIDLSELIRAYGEPPNKPPEMQQNATPPPDDVQQAMLHELQAMRAELVALRQEVAELKRLPAPQPTSETVTSGPSHEKPEPKRKPVTSFEEVLARFSGRPGDS